MAGGYTIKHRDEFESMEGSGDTTWKLARKALGTSAFGPLRYRMVSSGVAGDWRPLATVVRLPVLRKPRPSMASSNPTVEVK